MNTADFAPGNYRFIPAVFQYSGGVAAMPGHAMRRVRFHDPVPLDEGFRRIAEIITAAGRPLRAFAACELRSPAPWDDAGFRAFNERYVGTLGDWGIYDGKANPVARSNVCPEREPPGESRFYAFSFTVPSQDARPSFVIAGSGEAREGSGPYRERAVAFGDVSEHGLREKARYVLGEMERRLAAFGLSWNDTTATQLYTVYDPHPHFGDEVVRRGAARGGLTWHFCRPPVQGLDYEMDCRGIADERVV